MNERERWVVYPLLFLALGASLRDKFLKHVTTDEVECQQLKASQILCEEILVTDQEKPDRIVAKVTSSSRAGVGGGADGFGILVLNDSQGNEFCGVTNQALSVREISCFALKVVDPDHPNGAPLAALASAAVPPLKPGDPPQRFGVLALNNQEYGRLVGVPPVNRPALPPPANPPATEGENPPPAEPSRNGAGQ